MLLHGKIGPMEQMTSLTLIGTERAMVAAIAPRRLDRRETRSGPTKSVLYDPLPGRDAVAATSDQPVDLGFLGRREGFGPPHGSIPANDQSGAPRATMPPAIASAPTRPIPGRRPAMGGAVGWAAGSPTDMPPRSGQSRREQRPRQRAQRSDGVTLPAPSPAHPTSPPGRNQPA